MENCQYLVDPKRQEPNSHRRVPERLVIQREDRFSGAGQRALLQVEISIPSALFRNKPDMSEQDLATRRFGVLYLDESNSIFTAGALDFGLWGILVYPIVLFLLLSIVLRLIKGQFSFEVYVFALVVFVGLCMSPENGLSGYFGTTRNVLIFAAFIYAISKLSVLQWNSESPQAGW